MAPRTPRSGADPIRHTAVVGDVAAMWSKLAWDVDVFRDIQVGYPHEQQPLAYAAINVCIAATSLRNWAETAVRSDARASGRAFDRQGFDSDLTVAVPAQAMCEAIANTAKHSRFADGEWPGGRVSLEWEEGDEDSPPGWILRYGVEGAVIPSLSVNRFGSLPETWWAHLRDLGLVEGDFHLPEWQQNKLRRIFGHSPSID